MKENKIKKAYEELKFSEDLTERYAQAVISRESEGRNLKRRRLAPVMLALLLVGTTVYAAEKFDFLGWYYGAKAELLRDSADTGIYTAQNLHLKMSVEDAVFTEEYGIVFLHIQALDNIGKEFMERNKEVSMFELTAEGEEGIYGSSGESRFCERLSDEENWYYAVQATQFKTGEKSDFARVSFPAEDAKQYVAVSDCLSAMEITFPAEQIAGMTQIYTKCGEFEMVSVSPLAVTVSWNSREDALRRVKCLKITRKDGSVLELIHKQGQGYQPTSEWASIFSSDSGEEGRSVVTAIPKEVLDTEEIESVTLDGVLCQP